jgi:hypothetical protein
MRGASASTKQSLWILPIVLACGLVISGCFVFGNPAFWVTNKQEKALIGDLSMRADDAGKGDEAGPGSDDWSGMVAISRYVSGSGIDTAQRITNIALAAEAIDGTEIAPGEIFSFNAIVGNTESDVRYQVAPIVYGNEMSSARGGGICQVSSALYIAALEADMGIVERHPHSMTLDYVPVGLDATIVYGADMDLKIKNTSDHLIRIAASTLGQTVTVELLGKPLADGITVKAVSTIKEVRDLAGNQQQVDANAISLSDHSFVVTESFRNYYQNGIKIRTESLFVNTYTVNNDTPTVLSEGGFASTK